MTRREVLPGEGIQGARAQARYLLSGSVGAPSPGVRTFRMTSVLVVTVGGEMARRSVLMCRSYHPAPFKLMATL
jgi:hypothetical protein